MHDQWEPPVTNPAPSSVTPREELPERLRAIGDSAPEWLAPLCAKVDCYEAARLLSQPDPEPVGWIVRYESNARGWRTMAAFYDHTEGAAAFAASLRQMGNRYRNVQDPIPVYTRGGA